MRTSRCSYPATAAITLILVFGSGPLAAGPERVARQIDPQQQQAAQVQQAVTVSSPAALEVILKAEGDYCELVKKMALYFVCKERVQEKENIFGRGDRSNRSSTDALRVMKVNRQDFLFDYQIIKKGFDFQEKRVLLERDGKPLRKENAELNTLKVSAQNLVFGPVGYLSRYWQAHFKYELMGEETIDGKRAVIIRAVPSEERSENNNPARIWIDPGTNQIVRIEFEPQFQDTSVAMSADKWRNFMGTTPQVNFTRHFIWTVDYGPEKNGIRFPARQSIVEEYRSDKGYRVTKRSVTFEYSDYRFFTVDVEVKNKP